MNAVEDTTEETYAGASVPVTYKGLKNGEPSGALHVHHDDGAETVLPLNRRVTVPADVAEQLASEANAAVYEIEQG